MKILFGYPKEPTPYLYRFIVEDVGGYTLDLSSLRCNVEHMESLESVFAPFVVSDEEPPEHKFWTDITVENECLTLEDTHVYIVVGKSKYFNVKGHEYKEIRIKPEHEQKAYDFFKEFIDLFEIRP